jgi:DNA-binding CsgD family transcriptional regulator
MDVLRLLARARPTRKSRPRCSLARGPAGVHVTHILRKLDATTRVQAATVAERAGLLSPEPTHQGT